MVSPPLAAIIRLPPYSFKDVRHHGRFSVKRIFMYHGKLSAAIVGCRFSYSLAKFFPLIKGTGSLPTLQFQ
jgi:hypothetical protein